MKQNSRLVKFIFAFIFFQAHVVIAGTDNFGQQTNSEINSAAELQPLVCKKVPSPYWNNHNGGERLMVDDPACVAENNNRARSRASAAQVQAQMNRSSAGDGTQLVVPKAPSYTCGGMEPLSSEFQSCQNSYNAANKVYQHDLEVYNLAQNSIGNDQQTAELKAIANQKELESQKNKSATATLAEIKDKNEKGKKSFDVTAAITMGLGVAATIKAGACAVQCAGLGGGCCAQAPYWFASAAAMFLLNSKAKKQSGQHAVSAFNACESLNQLSSQPSSCSPPPSTNGSTTGTTTISYDPVTGKCLPEGAEECKQLPSVGAAPPVVKDALKTSAFASGKLPSDAFTIRDGEVKFKNGKTFKDTDFKDVNSLIAAGLSAGAAKGVMDSLSQASGGLTGLGANSKVTKKEYKDNYGATFGGADGATTVVDVNKGLDSGKMYSDKLKATVSPIDDRAPSSEGLAKEFNGELIGVAGDDIFLMMNRRYKLKSEQDSFIAQELK